MFRKTPLHIGSEEILSLPRDFSHLNYEVALFSDTDVYAGQDSHGTIKLFKFLRSIGIDCCLLLTGEKHLELEHSYYVGHIAPSFVLVPPKRQVLFNEDINERLMYLSLQIFGKDFYEKKDVKKQSKIINEYEMSFNVDGVTDVRHVRIYEEEFELMSLRKENTKKDYGLGIEAFKEGSAQKDLMTFFYKYILLGTPRLPNFKKVIFCSRDDAYATDEFSFNLLQEFKNNPLCFYYGMVHDTYTAFCAYPKSIGCDKFKFSLGCYNCKEIESHNKTVSEEDSTSGAYVIHRFNQLREIYSRWDHNVRYLGASSFSLEQAKKSYLFKEVKQSRALLPIDSLPDVSFEALQYGKTQFKQQTLDHYFFHYETRSPETKIPLLNSSGDEIQELYKKGKKTVYFWVVCYGSDCQKKRF